MNGFCDFFAVKMSSAFMGPGQTEVLNHLTTTQHIKFAEFTNIMEDFFCFLKENNQLEISDKYIIQCHTIQDKVNISSSKTFDHSFENVIEEMTHHLSQNFIKFHASESEFNVNIMNFITSLNTVKLKTFDNTSPVDQHILTIASHITCAILKTVNRTDLEWI
jgi:hypothetical protein